MFYIENGDETLNAFVDNLGRPFGSVDGANSSGVLQVPRATSATMYTQYADVHTHQHAGVEAISGTDFGEFQALHNPTLSPPIHSFFDCSKVCASVCARVLHGASLCRALFVT
jgi:hypothetical protein